MRKLLFILLASIVACAQATDILISTKDGASFVFEITNKSKVTFSNNELSIEQGYGDIINKFELTNLSSVKYSDTTAGGLENINFLEVQFEGEEIILSNMFANEDIALYNVAGVLLKTFVPDQYGTVRISTTQLTNGIYVLKTKKASYKFLKTK